jgi:hypothetical protein
MIDPAAIPAIKYGALTLLLIVGLLVVVWYRTRNDPLRPPPPPLPRRAWIISRIPIAVVLVWMLVMLATGRRFPEWVVLVLIAASLLAWGVESYFRKRMRSE